MSEPVTSHLCDRPALPVRLDKFLREAAGMTRREVESAWALGRIRAPVKHPGELIFPQDEVVLDEHRVRRRTPSVYCVLNKPAGVLTARRDPYGRECLEPWLGQWKRPVFPVGRLDRATTGLLLLTDDGDLAHLLMHPKFHVPKVYLAQLAACHLADDVEVDRLTRELQLQDGPGRAASAEIVQTHPNVVLRIEVDEGRKHLVRNLVHVAGYSLDHLHRVAMGPLELRDLQSGEVRSVADADLESVWRSVGGREMVWERRLAALRQRAERWSDAGQPHERLEQFLMEIER